MISLSHYIYVTLYECNLYSYNILKLNLDLTKTQNKKIIRDLFLVFYLNHLYPSMMQPVWPWVTGFCVDDGHVLTLFKRKQACISALVGTNGGYIDVRTDLCVYPHYMRHLALNSSELTGLVTCTQVNRGYFGMFSHI